MSENTTQLQVRGYFGQREWEPFCQNLMADRAWAEAVRRGGVVNIERYGESESRARLSLRYGLLYPAEWNTLPAWSQQVGSAQYFLATPPEAFRGPNPGMSFQNGAKSAASRFVTAAPVIGENHPFTVQFRLLKPHSEQQGGYWQFGIHAWRFEIADGRASVYRVTPQWTNALETEYRALTAVLNRTTGQEQRRSEIEALIFADRAEVDSPDTETWYDVVHAVTFLPDSRGVFAVVVEGREADVTVDVEDTRITATRTQGVLWPASPVMVVSNGGAYAWQLGRPNYARSGTYALGVFNALLGIDSGDIEVTVRGDANGGTATGQCIEHNVAKWEIVLTLTSDGLRSPSVYAAQAFAQGGARNGTDAVQMDTAQLPRLVIEDIQPTWEESNRRTSVQVVLRNVDGDLTDEGGGAIFPGYSQGTMHNFMHDRLGDVVVNGAALVRRGLVTVSAANNVRTVAAGGLGYTWAKGNSKQTLNISDSWALADEILLTRQPVGDGMRLGAYLRQLLMMGGWRLDELAGIDPDHGINLPTAILGEAPCVQPAMGVPMGDYLRTLIEKYAMGWSLSSYTGVWTFAPRSDVVKARFSKNASWADRSLPTPVYRILAELDITMDFTDSYNDFVVMGAQDEHGHRISSRWRWYPSINYAPDPTFVGRLKSYPAVVDEGIRTQSVADMVVRSVALQHGVPGRVVEFSSRWVNDLHPGDCIEADGISFRVKRLPGGSTRNDQMTIVAVERLGVFA